MVDAALTRLREPLPQPGGAGPRQPAKSTYGSNLVSADEFYARAGIGARPTSNSGPSSQATPNANNTSAPVGLDKSVLNVRAVDTISAKPANATKPISTLAATSSGSKLTGSKQPSATAPIAYGQAGLAGSRWATSPVVSPTVANAPSSEDVVKAVSISTTASAVIPLGTNEVTEQEKPSSPDFICGYSGVKISKDSVLEGIGTVRLVTDLGSTFANLEILVGNALILKEALFTSDTFIDEGRTIKFQPYSQEGKSSIWEMLFSTPYQSMMIINGAKNRQQCEPRPIQGQPLNSPRAALPNNELPIVEAPVNPLSVPNLPTSEHADASTTITAEAQSEDNGLLIDFEANETVSNYTSPTFQTLMILMTDETSIADLLDRLNEPTGGSFLDQMFLVEEQPPLEGYSPDMLQAARSIVLELYSLSDTFHELPEEASESLIHETSQKVLEKALSVWRARSKHSSFVYSADDLLKLRSHAITIEGKLIPEYDMMSGKQLRTRASSKASSLSADSYSIRSHHSTLNVQPLPPVSPAKSSAISNPPKDAGTSTPQFQKDPIFDMIQSDIQFQLQSPLDPRRGHGKKDSSSSTESCNTKDNRKATGPIKGRTQDSFKSEGSLLPHRDLDQKSDSTDSDLLTKLKGLNLHHSPTRPKSAQTPSISAKDGEGNPPTLPSHGEKSRSSIQEINNHDLKGAPGLAASRWAQDDGQAPTASGLRRTLSSRTPTARKIPPAGSRQPRALHTQLVETHYTPPPVAHPIHQPQYGIPHQAFVPQLATVLIQDPITGQMTEVTGIQKPVPPPMPFPGGFPLYQQHPTPHVPALFPIPSTFVTPRPSKPHGSSPLQGDAPSFSPKSSVRSPLSPTGRENSQIRGQGNTGSSPDGRQ